MSTIEDGYRAMLKAGMTADDAGYFARSSKQGPMERSRLACDSVSMESWASRKARWMRETEQIKANTRKFYGRHLADHERYMEQWREARLQPNAFDERNENMTKVKKLYLAACESAVCHGPRMHRRRFGQ
jgi:hypothetical protein